VIAPTATTADALSTAFCLMSVEQAFEVAARAGVGAEFVTADGVRVAQGL
jgi:thiamine biosynthesis lipoprotein ApbE